jgi:hypothetical protein
LRACGLFANSGFALRVNSVSQRRVFAPQSSESEDSDQAPPGSASISGDVTDNGAQKRPSKRRREQQQQQQHADFATQDVDPVGARSPSAQGTAGSSSNDSSSSSSSSSSSQDNVVKDTRSDSGSGGAPQQSSQRPSLNMAALLGLPASQEVASTIRPSQDDAQPNAQHAAAIYGASPDAPAEQGISEIPETQPLDSIMASPELSAAVPKPIDDADASAPHLLALGKPPQPDDKQVRDPLVESEPDGPSGSAIDATAPEPEPPPASARRPPVKRAPESQFIRFIRNVRPAQQMHSARPCLLVINIPCKISLDFGTAECCEQSVHVGNS